MVLMAVVTVKDDVSLLEEVLMQLSVKSLLVVLTGKPTLLCSVWTQRSYNTVQLKCLWKTKKNFDIKGMGQNLFTIVF